MESFDEVRLRQGLIGFEPWKRVVFMLLCCQRMVPNYEKFSADTGFGEPSQLWRGLRMAWTWIESELVPPDLKELRASVERQAPDTEGDFPSQFTSAALDAASAVAYVLDAVEAPTDSATLELAIVVARLARDTVDLYVFHSTGLDSKDAIDNHPLMQAELRRQREDIDRLDKWTKTKREAVESLQISSLDGSCGSLSQRTS
jgi:uncharacterized protein YjaG (DUF416 family)